jgi:uncharacterized protein (TIGR00255 family)
MTGFGTGRATDGERVYLLEIRSVNHRFCDVHVHVPRELNGLEARLETEVRRAVERGRIDVSLELVYAPGAVAHQEIDLARARGYRVALEALAREMGVEPKVSLEMLATVPGMIRSPSSARDAEAIERTVMPALEEALADLTKMRAREGAALREELLARLNGVARLIDQVRTSVPRANEERRARLEQRLAELMGDRTIDPARIAQEVAVLVDRADVAEELMRLSSHVAQMQKMLDSEDAVGRKLDFLLQEMHRETNTIGSKTTSASISHMVVEIKAELERMREQAQNVE